MSKGGAFPLRQQRGDVRMPGLLGHLLGGAPPPVERARVDSRLREQPLRRALRAHVRARVQRRQLLGAGRLVELGLVEVPGGCARG